MKQIDIMSYSLFVFKMMAILSGRRVFTNQIHQIITQSPYGMHTTRLIQGP